MKYYGRKLGMSRTDAIIMIGNLYINKNMTYKEIADKTGYAVNTVKEYLRLGGYSKEDKKKDEKIEDYIELDDNFVMYNNKIYRKMNKDELSDMLKKDLKIGENK